MLFDAPRSALQNGIFGSSISNTFPYPMGFFKGCGQNFWYTLSIDDIFYRSSTEQIHYSCILSITTLQNTISISTRF